MVQKFLTRSQKEAAQRSTGLTVQESAARGGRPVRRPNLQITGAVSAGAGDLLGGVSPTFGLDELSRRFGAQSFIPGQTLPGERSGEEKARRLREAGLFTDNLARRGGNVFGGFSPSRFGTFRGNVGFDTSSLAQPKREDTGGFIDLDPDVIRRQNQIARQFGLDFKPDDIALGRFGETFIGEQEAERAGLRGLEKQLADLRAGLLGGGGTRNIVRGGGGPRGQEAVGSFEQSANAEIAEAQFNLRQGGSADLRAQRQAELDEIIERVLGANPQAKALQEQIEAETTAGDERIAKLKEAQQGRLKEETRTIGESQAERTKIGAGEATPEQQEEESAIQLSTGFSTVNAQSFENLFASLKTFGQPFTAGADDFTNIEFRQRNSDAQASQEDETRLEGQRTTLEDQAVIQREQAEADAEERRQELETQRDDRIKRVKSDLAASGRLTTDNKGNLDADAIALLDKIRSDANNDFDKANRINERNLQSSLRDIQFNQNQTLLGLNNEFFDRQETRRLAQQTREDAFNRLIFTQQQLGQRQLQGQKFDVLQTAQKQQFELQKEALEAQEDTLFGTTATGQFGSLDERISSLSPRETAVLNSNLAAIAGGGISRTSLVKKLKQIEDAGFPDLAEIASRRGARAITKRTATQLSRLGIPRGTSPIVQDFIVEARQNAGGGNETFQTLKLKDRNNFSLRLETFGDLQIIEALRSNDFSNLSQRHIDELNDVFGISEAEKARTGIGQKVLLFGAEFRGTQKDKEVLLDIMSEKYSVDRIREISGLAVTDNEREALKRILPNITSFRKRFEFATKDAIRDMEDTLFPEINEFGFFDEEEAFTGLTLVKGKKFQELTRRIQGLSTIELLGRDSLSGFRLPELEGQGTDVGSLSDEDITRMIAEQKKNDSPLFVDGVQQGQNRGIDSSFIERVEGGFQSKAFEDGGRFSIGFGTPSFEGEEITQEEGQRRLAERIEEVNSEIDKVITADISPQQRTALASFLFNLGTNIFDKQSSKRLLVAINSGDERVIREEFLKFNKSQGTALRGLTSRRNAELDLFFG